MKAAIAIVGIACRYPDASSPQELWENVLAQRRAFRRMPPERLRLEDYYSADRNAPDATYGTEAALIEGFELDRAKFRVAGNAFRSVDLAHWLALDVADRALADAGLAPGVDWPRDATGVLVGNSLTGEFSRAHLMRLRWPYVRRVAAAALAAEEGWTPKRSAAFLERLERGYKRSFHPVGEESLAGGLSNTIAGRIASHFGLRGGGYTVDGACASSLLATAQACSALAAGDLDAALAGGVDLSLDPFELVGFAKTGALAADGMRVYDQRSDGFIPGEGCGFVVLMRHRDAIAEGRRVYATIRGWGVSSDGRGGITRPQVEGQLLALRRAYGEDGRGIDTVSYFEGHGTGTALGDATELRALSRALREATPQGRRPGVRPVIGSIKANIGHSKAAAGVAGLIKATLALDAGILPPNTGCEAPHRELESDDAMLRVVRGGEIWPGGRPRRAGVSAMGFGGINAHLVLEAPADDPGELGPRERRLIAAPQDAELCLLAGQDAKDLGQQVRRLLEIAPRIARAELADLASTLAQDLPADRSMLATWIRAAIVASSPTELAERLEILRSDLALGETERFDAAAGVFLAGGARMPRLGFLFPGQGSPANLDGGLWRRRFEAVADLYDAGRRPATGDGVATETNQPAVVTASLAGLRVLAGLGIEGRIAIGHSLGELTALHWAGGWDETALLRIATRRGQAMATLDGPAGAMASIEGTPEEVAALIGGARACVACYNAPRKTVISGEARAVAEVLARAHERGLAGADVPVSHAFHSPMVAAAAPRLTAILAEERVLPLERAVVSTVTGMPLTAAENLRELLVRQVTSPVRFDEALAAANEEADLWIEVGPGRVASELTRASSDIPALPLDAGGDSLAGLLRVVGAAFALGAPVRCRALFDGRFTRPFDRERRPSFFANPCELAPIQEAPGDQPRVPLSGLPPPEPAAEAPADVTALEVVQRLVVERLELPPASVDEHHRLLDDLHLSSITAGQLVAEAASSLGLEPPTAPTEFATATLGDVATALEDLRNTGGSRREDPAPAGVDSWVRSFTVELVERSLPRRAVASDEEVAWRVLGPPEHPLRTAIEEALGAPSRSDASAHTSPDSIALCLPPDPGEDHVGLLLEAARAVHEARPVRFLLVQHGGGGAFARTLFLETGVATRVVDVPADHPRAAAWIVREAQDVHGFAEVRYDRRGVRREPVLRRLPEPEGLPEELPIGPGDVLLVSGGGKGIAAECALSLARRTGVRLALLGRSRPEDDTELAGNLERIIATGITTRYVPADVTDARAVRSAVAELTADLGPVSAVLHGAGTNHPRLLAELGESAFRRTLAPKLRGLENLLAAVDRDRLRLLVTFGSIIARTGMRGEADYAVANAWLARRVDRFAAEYPRCRCLNVEWSLWSGVGMGERLGRVEALVRDGITPIPPDVGVERLGRLLCRSQPRTSVIVSGRFGDSPTLPVERPELPLLRFLERPRVFFPGVELVADAELSSDADPYLEDHVFQGERLFPAAMGLEAMAQVAMAVSGLEEPPVFERVRFDRPIVVPPEERVVLRAAALARRPERVDVVLRTSTTGFQVDHFRARCLFGNTTSVDPDGIDPRPDVPPAATGCIPFHPRTDLYDGLLFQRGRFQRISGYRALHATQCLAEIAANGADSWFGRYLPPCLTLGDPGLRDAAIHAVQACIPNATVLPVAVDRLVPSGMGAATVAARERSHDGDLLIYDLAVSDDDGRPQEQWQGLRLRVVGPHDPPDAWPAPLLAPYAERSIEELSPGAKVAVALELGAAADRRARSDTVLRRLLGDEAVRRRPDGKPEISGDREISVAHAGPLVFAVAGRGPLGCDLEAVAGRSASEWRDLLGSARFQLADHLARESREDLGCAATRVWAAAECLKKVGRAPITPSLTIAPACGERTQRDGWVVLESGDCAVLTLLTLVREIPDPVVLAILHQAEATPVADLATEVVG